MRPGSFPTEFNFILVVFAGLAAIVVILGYFSSKANQKRIDALRGFAQSIGFTFHDETRYEAPITDSWLSRLFKTYPVDRFGLVERFQGYYPFANESEQKVENLLYGRYEGTDFYCFDYSYETTSTDSKGQTSETKHSFSIVAARVPLTFSPLIIKPENIGTKLAQFVGRPDLRFESDEFNRRFHVDCENQKEAYGLLHPEMIEFFLQTQDHHWQFAGYHILLVQPGVLTDGYCGAAIRDVTEFLERVPTYLREDLGFTPTWSHALD